MANRTNQKEQFIPWFNLSGAYDDVILSTRVRLVRNLADFPFVPKMKSEDLDRVNSLIYDAFSSDPNFHFIAYKDIALPGREILQDKNIIKDDKKFACSSILLHNDESTSAIVNGSDHLKLSTFLSGLECEKGMEKVYKIDEALQEKLQFAASMEFGYLTTHIKNCGTGMKISLRIFVPSIIFDGKFDDLVQLVMEKNFCIQPVFKSTDGSDFANCLFDIFPGNSSAGTELDQLAEIQSLGILILKTERKIRRKFADNNPTIVLNFVKRNYAVAMYSSLLTYEEAVNIVGAIKWGLQIGIVSGILESDLNALLYRTKHGHLLYLSDNYSFTFEDDIKSDLEGQIQRLRSVVIQQAFENVKI